MPMLENVLYDFVWLQIAVNRIVIEQKNYEIWTEIKFKKQVRNHDLLKTSKVNKVVGVYSKKYHSLCNCIHSQSAKMLKTVCSSVET